MIWRILSTLLLVAIGVLLGLSLADVDARSALGVIAVVALLVGLVVFGVVDALRHGEIGEDPSEGGAL